MAKTDKTRAKGAKADAAPRDTGDATPPAAGAKRPGRSTTTATGDGSTAARRGGTRTARTAKEEGGSVPGGTEGGTTSTRSVRAAGPRAGVSASGGAPRSAAGARGANRQDDVRRESNLRADLREFASARPGGWNHDDWVGFLDHLRGRGHDVSDSDSVGVSLERERLAVHLEQIPGMGPRRVDALVNRYHTLYSLSHAGVDELAEVPGMNRALAERVRQQFG
jgi:excinuclease ABC subunit C